MNTTKKTLAVLLALTLLLTFTACGKDEGEDGGTTTTTTTNTTTTTLPSDGDELLPDDERDGSKELPFEIGGVLEFDAVVKAGGVTYYDVYRVDGTILTIEHKDATVEYNGKTYTPENGVISIPVSSDDILNPVKLAIGNKGATDATFKVTFTYPKGTLLNPYELTVGGDLVTIIDEGNEQGVVYLYTATEAGILAIHDKSVTKGQEYDIELYNLTSGANRTLLEDGDDGVVAVTVAKGDRVRVTYSVLLDDKNEYPAVTLKTTVGFTAGTAGEDKPTENTYTITVKDKDGKAMSGVKLQFAADSKTTTATTNDKGEAKILLTDTAVTVTLTVPGGYIAEKLRYDLTSAAPSLTITLEKEQTTTTKPTEPDEPTTMGYTVTLMDGKGAPMGGLPVTFYLGDKAVAKQVGDKKGVSRVTLERGTYTVKVGDTALKYDEKAAAVSVDNPNLTLILAADIDTSKSLKINDPLKDKDVKVYYAPVGAAYVTLTAGERNYFLFEPTEAGTYRFDVSNAYAKLGHFGTDMFVYTENSAEITSNTFTISVSEGQLGNVFVIGIDAATNCTAAVLRITRIGDPAWDINAEPWMDYEGAAPKSFTYKGGTLVNFDITAAVEYYLVYNEQDGYYHLNSQNGPVVYVRLGAKAPYVSIQSLLTEYGNMGVALYNPDGTFLRKEQYAGLMQQYVNAMDKAQGVYPLTKDLEYMLRNYGDKQNWWNEGEPGYLFEEVAGVNPNNAWTFLFCYEK